MGPLTTTTTAAIRGQAGGAIVIGRVDLSNQVNWTFEQIGCKVLIQTWQPFVYPQVHPEIGFTQDLSTLDLLLNCPETAGDMIRSAGSWQVYSCE